MRFLITITSDKNEIIPINYQYPLSAAIYKIINRASEEYAAFLHERGYGKGFKLFCFSDLRGRFKIEGDRLVALSDTISFEISFHLPQASQNFIKGLFMSQRVEIADRKTKAAFTVQTIEALPSSFAGKLDNEIIELLLKTASACVAGLKNERGNYHFLSPDDKRFVECLIYNWKEKIKSVEPDTDLADAVLSVELQDVSIQTKSRLMTIKAGTPAETKIRGFTNLGLNVMGEKRFVELLCNSGCGLYNAQGCGYLEHR